MVENIVVAGVVITAFYFIIRMILKKLAGENQINPCQGCRGCSMESRNPGETCSNTVHTTSINNQNTQKE